MPTVEPQTLKREQLIGLFELISQWKKTTTIIIVNGSVFEYKGQFPAHVFDGQYLNFGGDTGFCGHLNVSRLCHIYLQSKKHRGREAHAFCFFDESKRAVFKIFLGRDHNGNIFSDQLKAFQQIQTELTSTDLSDILEQLNLQSVNP